MYRLSGWSDVCVEKEKTQDFVRFSLFQSLGFRHQVHFPLSCDAASHLRAHEEERWEKPFVSV